MLSYTSESCRPTSRTTRTFQTGHIELNGKSGGTTPFGISTSTNRNKFSLEDRYLHDMNTPFPGIMTNFVLVAAATEFNINPDPAAHLRPSHDLNFSFMYSASASYIEETPRGGNREDRVAGNSHENRRRFLSTSRPMPASFWLSTIGCVGRSRVSRVSLWSRLREPWIST